mmetsp:Transcript_11771/g.22761  ORF Transcript_11771/g.22761 Transcript_11771/m.22761 type:complete len:248 (+) Transcript_11771:17-760(+)
MGLFLRADFVKSIEDKVQEKQLRLKSPKTTFFDVINSPDGFASLQSWFICQSGTDIDEYAFSKVLLSVIDESNETKAWEIVDFIALDLSVSFKEFCYVIILFAAAESQQTCPMLYMHGPGLFNLIAGRENLEISTERLRRLGRLLNIPERQLILKTKELGYEGRVSYDLFQQFYFDIFSEWDYRPEIEAVEDPPSPQIFVKQVHPVHQVQAVAPIMIIEQPIMKLEPVVSTKPRHKKTGCNPKCLLI